MIAKPPKLFLINFIFPFTHGTLLRNEKGANSTPPVLGTAKRPHQKNAKPRRLARAWLSG